MNEEWQRPSRDEMWIGVARAYSVRAACTHRRIGAVVVRHNHQMGGGYNGVVAGEVHCTDGGCPRGRIAANVREHANGSSDAVERKLNRLLPAADYSDCEGIHAEWNAMLDAGRSGCERSTMYVNAVPCALCKKLAKGAGIAAIVWYDDFGTGGEDFVQLSKDIDAVESVQLRRLKRRWDEQGQKMNDINTGDLL